MRQAYDYWQDQPGNYSGSRRGTHRRLVIGWHTERTRSEKRSHVVQFTEASVANTTIDANRPRWTPRRDATTSALRLPNTRCGVGIHKTVETVSKLDVSETSFPDTRAHTHMMHTRQTCSPEPSDTARRPVPDTSRPGNFYSAQSVASVSATGRLSNFTKTTDRSVPFDPTIEMRNLLRTLLNTHSHTIPS